MTKRLTCVDNVGHHMAGKYLTYGGTVFAVIVMDSVYRIWMDSDYRIWMDSVCCHSEGQCFLS